MDKLFLGASLAAYVLSFALFVFRKKRLGRAFFGAGWVINVVFIATEWVTVGHPPLANLFHVMVFLSACFLPACLVLAWRAGLAWLAPYFALVAALPAAYAVFVGRPVLWRPPPALRSPWWIPHVAAYLFSYALAAVAFVLTAVALMRRKPGRGREAFETASCQVWALGFPLMTFGLVSGALWAEAAWGRYWSWDMKETWALITWTLYVVYFWCRKTAGLRRFAAPAQIVAFLALMTTYLLVSLLPRLVSALHSTAGP